MKQHDSTLRAAIAGVLAFSSLTVAATALAAEDGKEQCAGIAKAGKNDCATSTNACHGHATVDSSTSRTPRRRSNTTPEVGASVP